MFWALDGLRPHPPGPVPKKHREQKEEGSHHLEEDDISHSAERPEETADSSRYAARSSTRRARRIAGGRSPWYLPLDRHRLHWRTPAGNRSAGLSAFRQALPGHAPHYAHPNPKHPADGLRFHTRL